MLYEVCRSAGVPWALHMKKFRSSSAQNVVEHLFRVVWNAASDLDKKKSAVILSLKCRLAGLRFASLCDKYEVSFLADQVTKNGMFFFN